MYTHKRASNTGIGGDSVNAKENKALKEKGNTIRVITQL